MKLKRILVGMFGIVLLSTTACTDLDTFPEGGILTNDQKKETVEANPELLAADISGMYSLLGQQYAVFGASRGRHDDFGYPFVCLAQDCNGPDMVTDNSNYNWFSTSSTFEDRNETYSNPYMRWALFYKQIKLANDIIKAIPAETENPTLKAYLGQAYAIRAFDYLSLAPNYQFKYKGNEDKPCVPIVTPEVSDPSNNPRATVKQVYDFIISDLDKAIALLEGYTRTSKGQIDQRVAYGLRARANLYMENWQAAADDATAAMQGFTPYSIADVSKPAFINANDPNWMWAIIITPANISAAYPSWPAKLSSFSGDAYTTGVGCYKMVNRLLFDLIPATDVRKGWWVDENLHSPNLQNVTWNGVSGDAVASLVIPDVKMAFLPYTNVKFAQYGGPGSNVNAGDWCIMRVEEMILIKAEALGMINEAQGKQVLQDFISTYRDPSYNVNASPRSFRDEVWFQRRVELWGEGFAFADVMRLGKNIVRFKPGVSSNFPEAHKFNIAANDGWLLLRIPQAETNVNLGIPPSANNIAGTKPVSGQNSALTDGVTD